MSPRRRRALAVIIGASVIALIAAAAWLFWRSEISIGSEFNSRGTSETGAQVATTQMGQPANWTSSSDELMLSFNSTEYEPGWEATAPLRVRLDPTMEHADLGRVVSLNVDGQGSPNAENFSYEVRAMGKAMPQNTACSPSVGTRVGGQGSLASTEIDAVDSVEMGGDSYFGDTPVRLCITIKANEGIAPAEGPTTVTWTVVSESR